MQSDEITKYRLGPGQKQRFIAGDFDLKHIDQNMKLLYWFLIMLVIK